MSCGHVASIVVGCSIKVGSNSLVLAMLGDGSSESGLSVGDRERLVGGRSACLQRSEVHSWLDEDVQGACALLRVSVILGEAGGGTMLKVSCWDCWVGICGFVGCHGRWEP